MKDHPTEAIVTNPTTAFATTSAWVCPCGSPCACQCKCPMTIWLPAVKVWCEKLQREQNGHQEEK